MRKHLALVLALFLAAAGAFGASQFFDKGEQLFVQNKPREALPLLESALNDEPANEKIYLYLGIIYQQLGDSQKAIDILNKGIEVSTAHRDLFYYNIGNDQYARRDWAAAEQAYTSALAANKELAEAYINRANDRMQLSNLTGAIADYTVFLQLRPQDPRRPDIERLMALVRQAQDDAEKTRQAEAARQKALMDDALKALNNAGDDTKNLSVDSIKGQTDPVSVDIKD
jgi:tetratricopeptide (TPR) repeat protein